jgi:hypothetical protein
MYNWKTTTMLYIPHHNTNTTQTCTQCRDVCEDWCTTSEYIGIWLISLFVIILFFLIILMIIDMIRDMIRK